MRHLERAARMGRRPRRSPPASAFLRAPFTRYPDPETPHLQSLWGLAPVQAGIRSVGLGPETRSWGLGGVTLPPPQPGC